ncbi:MAG: hypothetical protein OXG97_17940 [Candidatus Poribacteria bacterium]|nr:hypothetical protein [Candidatus Poribacteria bacterium]
MNEVFADTSGWASFFREQERHHVRAVTLMTRWAAEFVRYRCFAW